MNRWLAASLIPVLVLSASPISAKAEVCSYTDVPVELEGVNVCFPSFNLPDPSIESSINAHIRSNISRLFADWYQWPDGSSAEGGAIRIAIDEEQNVLSVLISVFFDIAGSAHPYTHLYAENYSLDDGAPLRPIDFLESDPLARAIRSQEIACLPESDARLFAEQLDYLSSMPGESLDRLIADESSIMWLPGETILVILPVPHALGDCAVLSVNKYLLS